MGWDNLSGCQGLGEDFWRVDGERRHDGKKDKPGEWLGDHLRVKDTWRENQEWHWKMKII